MNQTFVYGWEVGLIETRRTAFFALEPAKRVRKASNSYPTLRKLVFHFLGDSSPFEFEPNGYPFGSNSKGKLSPRSYPIKFERKWNTSFLSVESAERVRKALNSHPTARIGHLAIII